MIRKRKYFLPTCLAFVFATQCFSQIGAEAQGGKLSLWTALGIDQELSKKWVSVTDFGYGRHSDPSNNQFVKRQGLNVLTQDFIFKLNEHWHFSFSVGYWRRNAYEANTPYDEKASPYQFRNELRPYQKIHYNHHIKNIKISHTFRTDYRFYYNEDFSGRWTTPFEFRARYMEAWKFPLSKNKKNWFITNDEVLTAIDKYASTTAKLNSTSWSPYQITENRFSVYYRRVFPAYRMEVDLGVMHQYWRDKPGESNFNVSYNLMFDIIIHDPFSKHKNTEEEK